MEKATVLRTFQALQSQWMQIFARDTAVLPGKSMKASGLLPFVKKLPVCCRPAW